MKMPVMKAHWSMFITEGQTETDEREPPRTDIHTEYQDGPVESVAYKPKEEVTTASGARNAIGSIPSVRAAVPHNPGKPATV
jgi:hypothetical protein